MSNIIGLVGHCGPDGHMLRSAVKYAVKDSEVRMINDRRGLETALQDGVALLLINRVLDGGFDQSKGVDLIKLLRQQQPEVRLMLISNFEDAQTAAREAGALPGFGKSETGTPQMRQALLTAMGAAVAGQ